MRCEIKQYWDLSDDDLQAVHDHAVRENLLERTVYDAGLSRDLFQLFARRAECFGAVHAGGQIAGFFYLSHFEGATARLHLGLPGRSDRLARQVLDWCFTTFDFQSLLIVTPAADAEAAALWSALGADRLADVPGLCWLDRLKKNAPGRLFLLRPQVATVE